jgi:hypothetical protein
MPPLLSLLIIIEKGDVTTAYSQSREHSQPNAKNQLVKRTGPEQKGLTIPIGTRSPRSVQIATWYTKPKVMHCLPCLGCTTNSK